MTVRAVTATFLLSIAIAAQGIGTAEYYVGYGRGYFKARKYDMAIPYFKDALKKDPDHAEANYMMGMSLLKLGKTAEAGPFLNRAAEVDDTYRQKVEAETGSKVGENVPDKASDTGTVEYEVGDDVEVSYAGGWNAGKVIGVQGRGESVRVEVTYTFQGEERTAKFFYNGVRHAARPAKPGKAVAGKPAAVITPGVYGCSSKAWSGGQWSFTPRGSFTLRADGTYSQTNAGGRYTYDAAQNVINFIGGFFGNSNATGKVVSSSQIDITFSDTYWWTCALQK